VGELSAALLRTGRWDECEAVLAELPQEGLLVGAAINVASELAVRRGRIADARELLTCVEPQVDSSDLQDWLGYRMQEAQILNAEGKHAQALAIASEVIDAGGRLSAMLKACYLEALTAANELGDEDTVRTLVEKVEAIPRGSLPPSLAAQAQRFRALLGDSPEQRFLGAAALLREYRLVPEAALVQLDHAEWLLGQGRAAEAEPLLADAREVFIRLGAAPWLERADALDPGLAAVAAEAN
jgi:hypothetical protein